MGDLMLDLGGFSIYVFPRDHRPVHCHIIMNDGTNFRVFMAKEENYRIQLVRGSLPNAKKLKEITNTVHEHRNIIGRDWRRFHGD